MKKNQRLLVKIESGQLVIRIGVNTLAYAATQSQWATPFDDAKNDYIRTFAIQDVDEFAKDVQRALTAEAEDGSSLLTDMLDKASENAVNDGSLGLLDSDVQLKYNEFHQCETWSK